MSETVFCQVCSRKNAIDVDYCVQCGNKLLIVSGDYTDDDQDAFESRPEEQLSFDEHLLERISLLEEVVKRTAISLRQALGTMHKLEQKIVVTETGVGTLRDLLEEKNVFGRQEWSAIWEARLDRQLLALEKRDRFAMVKERIASLYDGDRRVQLRTLLDEAEAALLALDIEGAVQALEQADQLDPQNHELCAFLGETYFNEGQTEPALTFFRRVLELRPKSFESLVFCGVLHHERGEDDAAIKLLHRAAELYPNAFLPAFSIGSILAGQGLLQKALPFLNAANASPDALPQARVLLANCQLELGHAPQAIKPLEQVLAEDPTLAEAHFLLGLAYLDRGWHRKAELALRLAIRLMPQILEFHELMSLLEPLAPDHPAHADQSQALAAFVDGHAKDALGAYRRALALAPDDPTLLVGYAIACLELGRGHEIEPILHHAFEAKPTEATMVAALATQIEAWRFERRPRESQRAAERLIAETTGDLGRGLGLRGLATIAADRRDSLEKATLQAEEALALLPVERRGLGLDALGWVLLQRGEAQRALDCLSAANDLGSTARTSTYLGLAYLALGDKENARRFLGEAHKARARQALRRERIFEALKVGARLLQLGGQKIEP